MSDPLSIYTLGFLSLVIIIALLFFLTTHPKKWAYFYYATYSFSMAALVLRDVLIAQGIVNKIPVLVDFSVFIETISVICYALFAYYFIEDVILKSRRILRPFIVACIALMSFYISLFFGLRIAGVALGTLVKIHQDYHWIIATFGSFGILFFVLRLPTSLMVYILVGSAALAIGSGLTIYTSDPNFLFIVQSDNRILLNVEGCNMTYLQIGMLVDAIAFGAAMAKKNQYQRNQLQAAFEEMKQQNAQSAKQQEAYIEILHEGNKVKLTTKRIVAIQSDKAGRLEVFFIKEEGSENVQTALAQDKFSVLKEQLSSSDFFVARNRAPQCIIHRKYVQSISNVTIEEEHIKYQATAKMVNGLEVVIAKNKKTDFENWYKL